MISCCSNSHGGINNTQMCHNATQTDQNAILINVTLNLVLISHDYNDTDGEGERDTHTHTQGMDKIMEQV